MTNEEAKEILEEVKTLDDSMYQYNKTYLQALNVAIKALEQEPKTGHWRRVTDKTGHLVWECDKCGWQQRLSTNNCPNCGAKMEEEV